MAKCASSSSLTQKSKSSFVNFEISGNLGFELKAKPEGAFYIFPDISKFTNDDFDFCVKLLEEAHLAIVPKSKSSFVNFEISGKM